VVVVCSGRVPIFMNLSRNAVEDILFVCLRPSDGNVSLLGSGEAVMVVPSPLPLPDCTMDKPLRKLERRRRRGTFGDGLLDRKVCSSCAFSGDGGRPAKRLRMLGRLPQT